MKQHRKWLILVSLLLLFLFSCIVIEGGIDTTNQKRKWFAEISTRAAAERPRNLEQLPTATPTMEVTE